MSKEEKEKIHYKKYLITLSKDKINNILNIKLGIIIDIIINDVI